MEFTGEHINDLSIKGEVSLNVFVMSSLNDQVLQNKVIGRLQEELTIWLKEDQKNKTEPTNNQYTFNILYERYSEILLEEITKVAHDARLEKAASICYNLYLSAVGSIEGCEYLLFPNKTCGPTSDVVETSAESLAADINETDQLINSPAFTKNLTDLYAQLLKENPFDENDPIGNSVG